jgi:hypothetical protein
MMGLVKGREGVDDVSISNCIGDFDGSMKNAITEAGPDCARKAFDPRDNL